MYQGAEHEAIQGQYVYVACAHSATENIKAALRVVHSNMNSFHAHITNQAVIMAQCWYREVHPMHCKQAAISSQHPGTEMFRLLSTCPYNSLVG